MRGSQSVWTNRTPGIADRAPSLLGGVLKAIGRDVSGKGATVRAGIKAMFAMRIEAAGRSGLTKDQVAAIVRSLKQEMQAELRAAAENTAAELTGRIRVAVLSHRGNERDPSIKHRLIY